LPSFRHHHIPKPLYTAPQAIALFHRGDFGLTSLDDVKSERLQSAAVIVEVDDVGFGVFGQTKVFGEGIGVVGGGTQEGKHIDRDAFFGQGTRPFADVNAAFSTGIGAIADQKNASYVMNYTQGSGE
jgi:hypothetical protein